MTCSPDSKRGRSFASRLSLLVMLFTGLLFVTAAVIVTRASVLLIKEESATKATAELNATTAKVENVLQNVSVAVDNLAEDITRELLKGNKARIDELTTKVVLQNPNIIGSDVAVIPYFFPEEKYYSPYTFCQGDTTATTTQVGCDDYDYFCMEWYQIPRLLGHSYWTDPFFDEGSANLLMCTYTVPLYRPDSTFIGVFTADISLDWLSRIVNDIKPYKNSYNIILGKNGTYISHKDPDAVFNKTIFINAEELGDTAVTSLGHSMLAGESGMKRLNRLEGRGAYVFYAPIQGQDWSIAMVCPYSDVYAGVGKILNFMFLLAFFALIVLYIMTKLLIKKQVKPLEQFSESAKIIATGDFTAPLPDIKSKDEFLDLRNSLYFMQHSLTNYINELKETTSVKERIESELNIARSIQMGMIPKIFPPFPERHDIDLYATLRPAKKVGGDLYDFFINDEKLYFTIGDVSGKGVPASLLMAVTRSLFRSVATTLHDPAAIIESMNKAIAESNEENMFVTIFVGILNLETGRMVFCNGGHNAPCIINEDGSVEFMSLIKNLPIGVFSTFKYKSQELQIKSGQTIFLYTDGLTEAENETKELYSEPRLLEVLKGEYRTKMQELTNKVITSVEEFVNGAPQSDDLTTLSILYEGQVMEEGKITKTLEIINKISEIQKLTEFMDTIGEEAELSPGLTMSLNLAMEEAVSNVIMYAYPTTEERPILITYMKVGKELTFVIEDSGMIFDPTAKEDADVSLSVEERPIGGLGIFLVKKIMTSVDYRREDGKNIFVMKKILD